jgi:transmembrane sensor
MVMTTEKWQRYIDNQCTVQERKEIFYYLQSLPPQHLQELLEEGWELKGEAMPDNIALRMDGFVKEIIRPVAAGKSKSYNRWQYWAVACSVAISLGLYGLWQTQPIHGNRNLTIVKYKTISNTSANVQKIVLPDSSQIWLTQQSVVEIPDNYGVDGRRLSLQGEAYFEVSHNVAQPFEVSTKNVKTKVLGTHFNIESYSGEADTRVSLTQGSIAVKYALPRGADTSVLLTPGNRLIYQSNNHIAHKESVGVENEYNWRNGAVVLNNLAVEDVFERLGQRFGKKIIYKRQQFASKRFTGTYQREDLALILQNMAFVEGFTYTIAADSVFIHPSK